MTITSPAHSMSTAAPPYSALIRRATGVCLIAGALTNGVSQYVGHLVIGDLDFAQQVTWGAAHPVFQRTEQLSLVVSTLFMTFGLLGVAQVTRWAAPRLTLVAVPLFVWGMWGFHNVLAMGYLSGTAAPPLIGLDSALTLNDRLLEDSGVVWAALVPHLVGSFLGVLLLAVAAWRSGVFSRIASALVVGFLVWDFLLPSVGPLEAHLLLVVGWVWWGINLLRLNHSRWAAGTNAPGSRRDRAILSP